MAHRTRPSSRSSAPAARPSASRNSSPFNSMARIRRSSEKPMACPFIVTSLAFGAALGGFGLLLQAARLEHLAGKVEAEAEVVDQVEDREAQDQGVGIGHLQEDHRVAHEPERGERERE